MADIKINMMCGKRYFPEWYHVDGESYDHIDSKDIMLSNFEDNTVSILYCSHGLEYFDREEVIPVLKEWYRVLVPGGILRLAVPDFYEIARLYINNDYSLNSFLGPLYGKMLLDGNYIYHKTVYDSHSLIHILKIAGYNRFSRWDWKEVDHGKFDDHSQAYLPHMDKENGNLISLNIQAMK
jgi:predicted SAM-dependent methyltransferase